MPEQNPNDVNIAGLSAGARLRAVADGELGSEHLGPIDDAEARLTFERDLRASVARSMGAASAPESLSARVREALAAAEADSPDGAPSDVVRTPMGDTRDRSFWANVGLGRFAAIAAIVALAIGAVFLAPRSSSTPHAPTLQAGLLTAFLQDQHERCRTDPQYAAQKFSATDEASALELAREHLGRVPQLVERGFKRLERVGYRFAGMGRCSVPGTGPSVHVALLDQDGGSRMVSLFIQADTDEWILADAHYALLREGLSEGQVVVVWRETDHFLYLLFAGNNADLDAIRRELGVPTAEGELVPAR